MDISQTYFIFDKNVNLSDSKCTLVDRDVHSIFRNLLQGQNLTSQIWDKVEYKVFLIS